MQTTILGIDEDYLSLREMVWDLLEERSSAQHVHAIVDSAAATDPELDSAFAELGLFGIDVPEELGGGGGLATHLRHLAEGCGWAAATTRLVGTSTVIGALLAHPESERARALLPSLAQGTTGAAAALTGVFDPAPNARVAATSDGEAVVLDGSVPHVIDLLSADLVLVLAHTDDGEPLLALIETSAPGLEREREETLDLTRSLARLVLTGVRVEPAAILARGEQALRTSELVAQRGALIIAADSLGVAARVLNLTTQYAQQREQFDRAIGSFQSVKHQLADMMVRTEMSRALLDEAVTAVEQQHDDAPRLVSMAKDLACSSAAWIAGRGIQLHGGIGYTWEHEMHVYFKRAKLAEMLFGDRRWHRDRIAASLRAATLTDT